MTYIYIYIYAITYMSQKTSFKFPISMKFEPKLLKNELCPWYDHDKLQ